MNGDAIARRIAAERLPAAYRATVEHWWRPLAEHLAAVRAACSERRPLLIGINGAQGSGKSTLARFLELLLAERGLRVATLALDDLYLSQAERVMLAQTVHPLLRTRGVPGTHDVALGQRLLDALWAGQSVVLPRFDKVRDDRAATTRTIAAPLDLLLFEGWCVGCPPQAATALIRPVNALEAAEDRDGRWRRYVNARLAGDYAAWFARMDRLVMLCPPDFVEVFANRRRQERKQGGGMDDAGLRRFIAHYERLTRHMLVVLPDHVAVRIDLGKDQVVAGMAFRQESAVKR